MQLLEVKDLKTYFTTSKGKAKAVDGVYESYHHLQIVVYVFYT